MLWKTDGNEFLIPQKKDFADFSEKIETTYLFSIDNVPYYLLGDRLTTKTKNFEFKDITFFRTMKRTELAWLSLVGFHLKNWYLNNKFCGKCGSPTMHKPDERAMVCSNCNMVIYPQIAPAIIVAVICNNKILLIRGKGSKVGWHTIIAGYVDIGETLEQTVEREVSEEVGLTVKNIRYYKSQPWPLSGSMMIGFIAEADENEPIKIDEKEVSEAAWFHRGNLPPYSPSLSIAGEMIEKFERGEL
jgi:NAD+ diphosphatase